MTTERDLIQRLTKNLDHLNRLYNVPDQSALVEEFLDFLSQPEPEEPTDEEILTLSEEHGNSCTMPDGAVINPYAYGIGIKNNVLSFARALIAADRARCGRPTTTTTTENNQ